MKFIEFDGIHIRTDLIGWLYLNTPEEGGSCKVYMRMISPFLREGVQSHHEEYSTKEGAQRRLDELVKELVGG